MKPVVTVGVPVYNGGASLARVLQSLRDQSYPHWTCVISDNASTDETPAICASLRDDPRFEVHRRATTCDAHENFQAVLALAGSRYFMWLGHDDWLDPRYLERCVEVLEADPTVMLASGVGRYYDDELRYLREGVRVNLSHPRRETRVLDYLRVVADNATFYGVMRLDVLRRIELERMLGGDWLLLASLAYLGKIITVPDVSVHRLLGRSTRSWQSVVRALGVPGWQTRIPNLTVAGGLVRQIGWASKVFVPSGTVSRGSLALRVGATVLRRKYSDALVRRLRGLRARFSRGRKEGAL